MCCIISANVSFLVSLQPSTGTYYGSFSELLPVACKIISLHNADTCYIDIEKTPRTLKVTVLNTVFFMLWFEYEMIVKGSFV